MRFGISNLIVAILLFAVIYAMTEPMMGWSGGDPSAAGWTINDVRNYRIILEQFEDNPRNSALCRKTTLVEMKDYFKGALPSDHPAGLALNLLAERQARPVNTPQETDGWQHSFQVVENVVDEHGTTRKFGIYSYGRDGISTTQGNDDDDISTWRDLRQSPYQRANDDADRWQRFLFTLTVMPFIWGLYWLVGVIGKDALSRRKQ
ncbi:MAG: hypothetical protein QM811_23520 [Pirellulales bacterium]